MSVHINDKADIAKVVLMPGDPLRAKWIAETFLKKVKLVNQIRGMYGFTGYYKNKKVTIFGSGMGIPSIGIYSHELFTLFGAKYIIRVGSTGSIDKSVNIGDVIIVNEAYSDSSYAKEIGVKVTNKILKPSKYLLDAVTKTAAKNKIKCLKCRVVSGDAFYSRYSIKECKKMSGNAKAVEMEAFGLYATAMRAKKDALTILTCCDNLITHEEMNAYERQTTFKNMAKLALETAISLKI